MKIIVRRKPDPRILDPRTHPRSSVCLAVAAEFLGINERTVRARIDDGQIDAVKDGKSYRISLTSLIAYDERRRLAS